MRLISFIWILVHLLPIARIFLLKQIWEKMAKKMLLSSNFHTPLLTKYIKKLHNKISTAWMQSRYFIFKCIHRATKEIYFLYIHDIFHNRTVYLNSLTQGNAQILSESPHSSVCLTTKSWLCKQPVIRVQGARGGELSIFICSGFGWRCWNIT